MEVANKSLGYSLYFLSQVSLSVLTKQIWMEQNFIYVNRLAFLLKRKYPSWRTGLTRC